MESAIVCEAMDNGWGKLIINIENEESTCEYWNLEYSWLSEMGISDRWRPHVYLKT